MRIEALLKGLTIEPLESDLNIKGLALDSRQLEKDFAFIAIAGSEQHGLEYAQQAEKKGAVIMVFDPLGSDCFALDQIDIKLVAVEGLARKLGVIADRFYGSPSTKLDVIGITGTNGKTTCSQFLLQMTEYCGVIGTLGWGDKQHLNKTINTTPDALVVHKILADFVSNNKTTVVMEVSSHGLEQGRVNAVSFKGAIFTNLSRDHLDYHGSMDAYLQAKLALFKRPELQFVVVNANDVNSKEFLAVTGKSTAQWAFSATGKQLKGVNNLTAENVEINLNGISFIACYKGKRVNVKSNIVGSFNLENILTVMIVMLAQGTSIEGIAKSIADLEPVSGRMECLGGGEKPVVIVDYAHTPDAMEKVLKELCEYGNHKLKLVFGCGGDRDKGKRQQMGEIAGLLADEIIMTNDNPRFEDPEQIVNDIVLGCKDKHYRVIVNRQEAISNVINKASRKDCIVVLGKGHEDYQEIKGVRYPFSDQMVAKQALLEWTE